MVSVPLRVAGTPAGALNCYRTQLHTFDADELDLLITLADQAGIAIETARLRDRERDTIADLEELNESLTTQHRLLQEADQIHRDLTSVALRAAGVQGVAAALSDSSPAPCSSPTRQGTRSGALRRTEPAGGPARRADRRDRLRTAHGAARPGRRPTDRGAGAARRRARGADLAAGPLVDLGPLGHRAVEHGATVAALELLRRRTALEVEWRLRGTC
ncbi:GAF domain-containing protein [Streptomyces thermocarboxydus]